MNQESQSDGSSLVQEVRTELHEIDAMAINDHTLAYEELHTKLATALSAIDGL